MYQVTVNAAMQDTKNSPSGFINVATLVVHSFPNRLTAEFVVEQATSPELIRAEMALKHMYPACHVVVGVRHANYDLVPK